MRVDVTDFSLILLQCLIVKVHALLTALLNIAALLHLQVLNIDSSLHELLLRGDREPVVAVKLKQKRVLGYLRRLLHLRLRLFFRHNH